MSLSLKNLCKAVDSLDAAIAQPKTDFLRDSVIQRFEYSYELAWKAIRKQLIDELGSSEVDGLSRRDLFRKALAQRLISDFELWIEFHEARNSTSHNYDETNSERVYSVALSFATQAKVLIRLLEGRGWTHEP
jgi:nucleotidyltransferase substrate binding protein (TIGR01987 family)